MKHNTIEIKLNSYGTLEVVSIPVKLYKDSYNVVKLRVNAPLKEKTMLKVYSSSRDDAGEQIWTSDTYSLPQKTTTKIDGVDYNVYEGYIPQEFCEKEGDVVITFAQVVDNNGMEEILTSGTLNLYISGEGFNYNGVNTGIKLSEMDGLAIKVNGLNVEVEQIKNDIIEVKEDASLIKQNIEDVNTRIDDIKIPTKVSELENDALYGSQSQFNTWTREQSFTQPITIGNPAYDPIVVIGHKWRETNGDGTFYPSINYTPKGGTQQYLYFPKTGGRIALTKDHYTKEEVDSLINDASISSDTLLSLINDSESIVASKDGNNVKFEIDAEIQSKIAKSLITPMSIPTTTELVAVDNTNSQKMIGIGAGLSLENGTLISVSDVLSLDSDQMDDYMADGGLLQGQLAICNKVITNGYDVGALYRFDIKYPNTYSWTKLSYSKSEIDNMIGNIEVLLREV